MKTKIINLYGGPGTGKSTSAAFLFYQLKATGHNAELVREYVKDWAWDKRSISTYDQLYFLGKQSRKESMLYGKVDSIVTDSPCFMSAFYAQKYCPPGFAEGIKNCTLAFYNQAMEDGHQHVHVFLHRTKKYNPAGRFQTEDEAKSLDVELREFFTKLNVPYIECGTDQADLETLVMDLKGI